MAPEHICKKCSSGCCGEFFLYQFILSKGYLKKKLTMDRDAETSQGKKSNPNLVQRVQQLDMKFLYFKDIWGCGSKIIQAKVSPWALGSKSNFLSKKWAYFFLLPIKDRTWFSLMLVTQQFTDIPSGITTQQLAGWIWKRGLSMNRFNYTRLWNTWGSELLFCLLFAEEHKPRLSEKCWTLGEASNCKINHFCTVDMANLWCSLTMIK